MSVILMKSDEVLVISDTNEDSDEEKLKPTNPQLLLFSPAKTGFQVSPVNEDQQNPDFCIKVQKQVEELKNEKEIYY